MELLSNREENMLKCVGFERARYSIHVTEPGVRLNFQGPDASFFTQIDPPAVVEKVVKFDLTMKDLHQEYPGFLPDLQDRHLREESGYAESFSGTGGTPQTKKEVTMGTPEQQSTDQSGTGQPDLP